MVASAADLIRARQVTREVAVGPEVLDYALSVIVATHPEGEGASEVARKYVRYGSSPRGAQALVTAAKVYSMLEGRFNVSKESIQKSAKPVLRHRIILNYEAEADGMAADAVIDSIVASVNAADKDPIRV